MEDGELGDIDLGLRMVSQLMPEALAAPFVAGAHVERGTLPQVFERESQLSRRELRTDKLLGLKIDGRDCLLHVEFQTRSDADMAVRVLEYVGGILAATPPSSLPRWPGVESVVVLIDGAQNVRPGWRSIDFGWPRRQRRGCVARWWLEPVYRRRLAELRARPVLWWVFAPVARDIDERGFDALLQELARRVDNQRLRAELGATMRVIAERNQRMSGLAERIGAVLGEEVLMQSEFLRSIREQGRRANLLQLFELRLGRPLTEAERAAFDAQLEADAHEALARAVLEHDADGLAAWLARRAV